MKAIVVNQECLTHVTAHAQGKLSDETDIMIIDVIHIPHSHSPWEMGIWETLK